MQKGGGGGGGGGLLLAAANAGVEDQLFKRHGRWRSENAKDYIVNANQRTENGAGLWEWG